MSVQRKKLVVHVGPWLRLPGTTAGIYAREDEVHLCYEPDKNALKILEEKLPSNVGVVLTEFQKTRLKPNSVDRAYAHNVLCEKRGQNHAGILEKLFEVLKPGSKLIIGHTNTPREMPFTELKFLAGKAGFNSRILVEDAGKGKPTESQKKILKKFMGEGMPIDPGFYLAVLAKPKR